MSANEKGFVLVNEKYLHWLMKSICVGKWTCRENICRVYGQSTRRLISVLANEPLIVGTPHTCPLTIVLSCAMLQCYIISTMVFNFCVVASAQCTSLLLVEQYKIASSQEWILLDFHLLTNHLEPVSNCAVTLVI